MTVDFSDIHNKIGSSFLELTQSIKQNENDEEITAKFNCLVDIFVQIGSYTPVSWGYNQTFQWWGYLSDIGNSKYASSFISILREKLKTATSSTE
ncbi:hypothetical protein MACH09_41530 [Vibrio sp. MACH09]|uniref:hypothetical protein n=1 Tax=Vibrio sp. MACH09 TaxID=3025122 RepID=UPI0027947EDF|nr:hypothetical protein [Vibrio sp. MACH09]GLO63645.1 hypothetical protein MACH09_41530 [Vibrio sp. MACH09]